MIPGKSPLLTVVIPTLGRNGQNLLSLIRSLNAQSLDSSMWEVLVIFNGTSVVPEEVHQLPEHFHVFHLDMANVSRARNMGFRYSQGDYLFFVDDDCELLEDGFLSQILEHFKSDPALSALGGRYKIAQNGPSIFSLTYHLIADSWLKYCDFWGSPFLVGGCMALRKSAVENLAPLFDEDIQYGSAETSANLKITKAGLKRSFLESLQLQHNTSLNLRTFVSKANRQGWGQEQIANRQETSLRPVNLVKLVLSHPSAQALNCGRHFQLWLSLQIYALAYDWGRARAMKSQKRERLIHFSKMLFKRLLPLWHGTRAMVGQLDAYR